jgi:hypothetical protein
VDTFIELFDPLSMPLLFAVFIAADLGFTTSPGACRWANSPKRCAREDT